jgi:DNA-binding IclR family transcriptional regulator
LKRLLRRGKGASLAELQNATAWQPHSVRAFLSGLRKKGLALSKEQRRSGETAYRLVPKAAPAVQTDA